MTGAGIPITTRLDERAVEALGPSGRRGSGDLPRCLVATAVSEWLSRHGEEAIAESYRRRYEHSDVAETELIARLGAFSAGACLDNDDR